MEALDLISALPDFLLLAAIVIVVFGLFSQLLNTPTAKGRRGEASIKSALFSKGPSDNRVLHDVTLPTGNGTTQIDHIFISPCGVFCIETKHMQGWIFGSEQQRTWTQVIYKKKTKFQNPLRQNYKHTETLRSLLNLPKDQVHSVIAFTSNATFRTEMPPNVGSTQKCMYYIQQFSTHHFTKEQVQHMYDTIQTARLEPTRDTHQLHVQNLKTGNRGLPSPEPDRRSFTPQVPDQEGQSHACLKCGAPMKLRTARKGPNTGGQFWGCSTFPKCRKTLDFTPRPQI